MKKFLLTLCLMMCCLVSYPQHFHPTHHSSFHRAQPVRVVHRNNATRHHDAPHQQRPVVRHQEPIHPAHKPAPVHRPYPVYRLPMMPLQLITGGIIWYVITKPHHDKDTYMYDDHEYKLCPECHKMLIPLDVRTCHKCVRPPHHP